MQAKLPMNQILIQTHQQHKKEFGTYDFKINTELCNGIAKRVGKNFIRDKKADLSTTKYKIHDVLWNRADRRYGKSPYFSERA